MNWQNRIFKRLVEEEEKPKKKTKKRDLSKMSGEDWSWFDPEGVHPKNPLRGMQPTIHASGLRSSRTGEPIKKRR